MKTKIKLLKKISLGNLGKIASQSLNKRFQNFKKKRAKEIATKTKKQRRKTKNKN